MQHPKLSVIMPVYNAAPFLREAIDSILTQTFTDFEFLIFNDGSTDNSGEIIRSYSDDRINFFDSEINKGLAYWLNEGLKKSQGKYIARMDADDIAHPERFARQLDFLDHNNEYVLCGTCYESLPGLQYTRLPVTDEEIKVKLLSINPFCHPSVVFRAKTVRDHNISYTAAYMPTEDRDMWVKMSQLGKVWNVELPLLKYRVHGANVSLKRRTKEQNENEETIKRRYIATFFQNAGLGDHDIVLLYKLFCCERLFSLEELENIRTLVNRIIVGKYKYPVNSAALFDFVLETFFYRCTTSTANGLGVFRLANSLKSARPSFRFNLKLFLKSAIKYKI
jgi:glycosyltransferase involved in cell wall biosynthesis